MVHASKHGLGEGPENLARLADSKPTDGIFVVGGVFFDLMQEVCVPTRIFLRMTAQKPTVLILSRPPDRVEFVISHDCACSAGFALERAIRRTSRCWGRRSMKSPTKSCSFADFEKHHRSRCTRACAVVDAEH
jgi:hypothetical protein